MKLDDDDDMYDDDDDDDDDVMMTTTTTIKHEKQEFKNFNENINCLIKASIIKFTNNVTE